MNNVFKLIITMTFLYHALQNTANQNTVRRALVYLTVLHQTFSSYAALIVLAGQCFFFYRFVGIPRKMNRGIFHGIPRKKAV